MNKEKRIQECESKQLIDELSKMPPMVIATAYLYAINYTLYGEDVTEKWVTATQNASALEKAYKKGYYDALEKTREESEPTCDTCEYTAAAFNPCNACKDKSEYKRKER